MRLLCSRWAHATALPGYALGLALLVLAPALGPGYLLLRDAVSTPRSYLSDSALGLMAPPRATPQDFAVALTSHLIDGGVVVKALLVLGLWLAGWGATRLAAGVVPDAGMGGQFVAATLAIWNPYVAERLLQGHWSLLLGYGCLPWTAATMLALRSADGSGRAPFFGLALWIGLAGLTPTGLMLAAAVALLCATVPGGGQPRWLCAAAALAVAVVAALPWLTASALGPSAPAQDWSAAAAVAAFAARAEPGLGTLGSLANLGGIWNAEAVPTSRTTFFAVGGAVALVGVVGIGLPAVLRRPAALRLLVLAAVSLLVPAALATRPGMDVLSAVVQAAPGLGVLRDGQKWVALAMPGYALAGAGAVVTLRRGLRPAVSAAALSAALILTLPDLAYGVWGQVKPVRYPPGWAAVAAAIDRQPGLVAVLPAGTMRRFSWSGPAPVLDPLPRWVHADVLSTGDLTISGLTIRGEGGRARAVQTLLLAGSSPAAVARAGVAWLVVESGTPGDMGRAPRTLDALPVVYRDADLALLRVGGETAGISAGRRRATVTAHLAWLALLAGGAAGLAVSTWRMRARRAPHPQQVLTSLR
ncbi:hypothetical protein [Mycobacterium botniense]|uniref:Transmembrane protein n=1 Tax=Mycobacterium botniense TaxID=84962 RepID=A0A7I9XVZ0_9MYCO|nr:hypothetical protein [Mycobacterium botniense]GFG73959.1 hypothetical protein MBOT_13240 [Mycobacterium botniense]